MEGKGAEGLGLLGSERRRGWDGGEHELRAARMFTRSRAPLAYLKKDRLRHDV